MQKLLLTIIMIFSAGFSMINYKNNTQKPIVVLELFTSQGCSSCPAADALLYDVKNMYKDNNVIALSYHVAYWDYIGWKDPFANISYADKQRAYARKFKSNRIYTPQLVVNGKEDFVGSNRLKMQQVITNYSKTSVSNAIAISNVNKLDDTINFEYTIKGSIEHKELRIVLVIDERETYVERGENRKRTLKNTNIVVSQKYLSLNLAKGKATISIPNTVLDTDDLRLITLIEANNLDITGATEIPL